MADPAVIKISRFPSSKAGDLPSNGGVINMEKFEAYQHNSFRGSCDLENLHLRASFAERGRLVGMASDTSRCLAKVGAREVGRGLRSRSGGGPNSNHPAVVL